jgi:hypothetical protein
METTGLNTRMLHQVFHQGEFSTCVIITFQVMAFAGMSPGYPDGIRSLPQARQNKFGTHPSGAGNADDTDVGRIFHSAHTRQVGGAVAAPVAKKTQYLRFIFSHAHISCLQISLANIDGGIKKLI